MKIFLIVLFISSISFSWARNVSVNGYYRKNGTYVRPHVRSSPDLYKWNNYGPSKNDNELMNPTLRDSDKDGTPNYLDKDDNNNGLHDDLDNKQYRKNKRFQKKRQKKEEVSIIKSHSL